MLKIIYYSSIVTQNLLLLILIGTRYRNLMISNLLFSESLGQDNVDTWNKILNHKFITEISKDILPLSKFIFYLKQDQIFLKAFRKLLDVASRIASDKQTRELFEGLVVSTLNHEMPMQNEIIHQLEVDNIESTGVSMQKTTHEYISHITKVSDSRDLDLVLSAIIPCPWTYYEISELLINHDIRIEAFKQWIRFYSSKESRKQVMQLTQQLNKLAGNADGRKKIIMRKYFSLSCNYEREFWEMAYSYKSGR